MSDERELLRRTAELAADFLDTLDERSVFRPRRWKSYIARTVAAFETALAARRV